MTIPDIRGRLHELAAMLLEPDADIAAIAAELHYLAEESKRRSNGRRAPVKNGPLSTEQVWAIQGYADSHPTAALNEIGARFGANQGRVSEVLFGKRT